MYVFSKSSYLVGQGLQGSYALRTRTVLKHWFSKNTIKWWNEIGRL